jgi:hypothetical protein
MPRKKKTIQPESEDEVYERFLKKLLKDPRFKQYRPMAIKALAARGFGGGGRGGRGGRSAGMLQTPNQDNFIKIHSAILETNSKLSNLSNQMKRGGFDEHSYLKGYFSGMQGNSQPSPNIPPPAPTNTPLSISEHAAATDAIPDEYNDKMRSLTAHYIENGGHADIATNQGEQGNAQASANIPPPSVSIYDLGESTAKQGERVYTHDELFQHMNRNTVLGRLKHLGVDVSSAPTQLKDLRVWGSQKFREEQEKNIHGAAALDLTQSRPRGRPRLPRAQAEDELTDEEAIVEES